MGRAWVFRKSKARTDEMVSCIVFWEGEGLFVQANLNTSVGFKDWERNLRSSLRFLFIAKSSRCAAVVLPDYACSTWTHEEPIEALDRSRNPK